MAKIKPNLYGDDLNIRVTPDMVGLIDYAAKVYGKTRTDFILDTMRKASEEAVLDQRLFVLDTDEWDAFNAALDASPQPNTKLEALLARIPAWNR